MGRPHKFRRISPYDLRSQFFQPNGIEEQDTAKIFLTSDEIEALRLKHYINLKQTEAAEKMGISQTTYSRILNNVIGKITKALIEGKGIAIQNAQNEFFAISPLGGRRQRHIGRESVEQPLNSSIIFDGWGCIDCGFQFQINTENNSDSEKKPLCPECKSSKTYRLVKKR